MTDSQMPQPSPQPDQAPAPEPAPVVPVVPEPPSRRPRAAQAQPIPGAPEPAYGTSAAAGPAVPVVPQPLPRKSYGWIVALVAVVLFAIVCLVGIGSCSSTLTAMSDPFASAAAEAPAITSDCIGIIELDGTIDYDGSLCSPEGLKDQLDRAEADRHIKAIVLRVNSGGGAATAGEEMAAYIRDFSKPVVVSSAGSNMSAAYEISSQADYIFVDESTFIGAIGTVIQTTNVGELLSKLGIQVDNITSADSKDSSYGTRALTEEERAHYQAMVDQVNEAFIQRVADGRGMDVEEVRELATGMPFTGVDAVDNGLADETGLLEDAVAKAAELAHSSTSDVVYLYSGSSSLSDLLDLVGESRASADAILGVLQEKALL